MRYMFLDNYRGFNNTIFPLKDVNFLVGENSTGKTSLLALINSITKPSFWMSDAPSFGSQTVSLGNFKDIVSANAKDKSYFRIGLFLGEEGHKKNIPSAYLITFKEREGMPFISRYTLMEGKEQIQIKFMTTIQYKYENAFPLPNENIERVKELFMDWTKEHAKSSKNYKSIKGPRSMRRVPLGMLNAAFSHDSELEGKKRTLELPTGFSFSWSRAYKNVTMLAPIRTKPKRTYDEYNVEFSPEGEHTPYLIKKYFRSKTQRAKFLKFINKFGAESGLFKTIKIKSFGRLVTSPFELDVLIDGTMLKTINVGYGVSQVLPIVVEIFEASKKSCFLLQQPEIHLHPRAQAALGNLFNELNVLEDKCFFIETHSDYIINSFRYQYRKGEKEKKPEGQILYFERLKDGNHLYTIDILKKGELPDEQPPGYRDFFIKEQMRMLGF